MRGLPACGQCNEKRILFGARPLHFHLPPKFEFFLEVLP